MGIIARFKSIASGKGLVPTLTLASGTTTINIPDDTNNVILNATGTVTIGTINASSNIETGRIITLTGATGTSTITITNNNATTTKGQIDTGSADITFVARDSIQFKQRADGAWDLITRSTATTTVSTGTITTLTSTAITTATLTSTGVITPTGGVAAGGGFTASPRNCHTGNEPAIATTSGTNSATNTDGTVYLAEDFVPCNMSVTGVAIFNGTAVAGNGKVMLYDSAGTRVAISASTAMSGTTAYQLIPFTGAPIAVVGPATYFIGATYDTSTHDLRGHVIGSFATGTDAGNTYATDSTFATVTLPTTFTADIGPIASLY